MTLPIFQLPLLAIMTILKSMRMLELKVLSRTSNRVKGMVEDVKRSRQIGLLKAPLLIGREIIRSMGFVDLFVLAHTSKLMRIIVQQEIKVRNHSLALFIQPGAFVFQFTQIGSEESSISIKPKLKINPETDNYDQGFAKIEVHNKQSHFITRWTSVFGGMKGIYNDINEIFKIPFRKIFIDLKIVGMGYKVVFNWINSISSEIPVIQVAGDCSFEAYSWVFDNLRPTKEVQFLAKPVESLAKEAHPIKHDIIFIKYGEWVKVEHLKAMESSSIYIGNSSITDEQINEFLHALVSGSNPNLKKLVIGITRDPDADLLLDALDATLNDEHIWSIQLGNGRECIVQNVTYKDEEQEGIEIDIGRNGDVRER